MIITSDNVRQFCIKCKGDLRITRPGAPFKFARESMRALYYDQYLRKSQHLSAVFVMISPVCSRQVTGSHLADVLPTVVADVVAVHDECVLGGDGLVDSLLVFGPSVLAVRTALDRDHKFVLLSIYFFSVGVFLLLVLVWGLRQ